MPLTSRSTRETLSMHLAATFVSIDLRIAGPLDTQHKRAQSDTQRQKEGFESRPGLTCMQYKPGGISILFNVIWDRGVSVWGQGSHVLWSEESTCGAGD